MDLLSLDTRLTLLKKRKKKGLFIILKNYIINIFMEYLNSKDQNKYKSF